MADVSAVCHDYEKIPLSRLEPGDMGVLLARAGAGKTACLTHLALGYLLNNEPVLHICVDVVPDKVKIWYHELLKDIFSNKPEYKVSDLEHFIEPLRFIMSFLNQTFNPQKLEVSIDNLKQQAKFVPSLIILDGLDFGHDARPVFEKISDLARRHSIPIWMSARSHRHMPDVNERGIPYPIDSMDDLFSSVFVLQPEKDGIMLRALKQRGNYNPADSEFLLDPNTFLLLKRSSLSERKDP
jgi:hypothetical protein